MPTADAYPLLADGTIDALWSGPNAGFVNAVQAGFEMKWVLSNYFPHDDSKTGLWINASDSESRDPVDLLAGLSGATVGSVTGSGSVLAYPLANALAEAELSIEDVRLEVLPFADIVVALQNGSIYAGWIVDPLWQQLVDDPDMVFAVAQPPAEPLGGLLYGPNLAEDREAGVALIRAIIRTMNTYFQGDYKSDPEFLSELATRLDQPEDVLGSTPPLIWDWEIRQDTIMRMQDAYIQDGSQESDPLPEDQLVDRSYYAEAVGHTE